MTNTIVISGIVQQVTLSNKENPSALILLQYGPSRERTENRAVEFINAIPVRIPPQRLEHVGNKLKAGAFVHIIGRVQGVMRGAMADGFFTVELVADRINFTKTHIPANTLVLTGEAKNITLSDKEKPAALFLLQYGPVKERNPSKPLEFMNAVPVRVPPIRYEHVREQLKDGASVSIIGRCQGVLKGVMSDGYITTELVADRLNFGKLSAEAPVAPKEESESKGEAPEAQSAQ